MKIFKHLFNSKPKQNPKYEPNTLAEMNGSPDLRLATAKGKEADIPLPAKKPVKKVAKKSTLKSVKKEVIQPISEPVSEPVAAVSKEPTKAKSTNKAKKSTANSQAKKPTIIVVSKESTASAAPKKAPQKKSANSAKAPTIAEKESVVSAPVSAPKKATNAVKKSASGAKKVTKTPVNEAPVEVKTTDNSTTTSAQNTRPGRFEIKKSKDGRFVFNLYASNSVIVATSQIYSSSTSAMNGIKSVIANAGSAAIEDQTLKNIVTVPYPKWEIYQDKGEQYRFRLCASNGSCVCHSQGYTSKANCKKGIESIIKFAADAEITKAYLEKKEK